MELVLGSCIDFKIKIFNVDLNQCLFVFCLFSLHPIFVVSPPCRRKA